jgi:hypothetical protein
MMPAHRRLAMSLLLLVLPDEQPLAGDLCEVAPERSAAWLWRQVLLALPAHLLLALRTRPRAVVETALVSTAMLALLGFHALVVASLLNHLLVLNDVRWIAATGRFHQWQGYTVLPAFLTAVVMGRFTGRFHRDHRVAAILLLAASATTAAFLNLLLFVPGVLLRPFVPSAALQTAISMVFVAGLFVGIASRSRCEPLHTS